MKIVNIEVAVADEDASDAEDALHHEASQWALEGGYGVSIFITDEVGNQL